VSALAREIMADLARAQPERRVELTVAEGLDANGDPGLIQILLENLLENAWKYTAREPVARIKLAAYTSGRRTTFFVRDNGVGFDTAYAQRLFTPFQRFHAASEFEGTGVGLSTVRRIVNRHGGQVWVRSKVGVGTIVLWTLGSGSP